MQAIFRMEAVIHARAGSSLVQVFATSVQACVWTVLETFEYNERGQGTRVLTAQENDLLAHLPALAKCFSAFLSADISYFAHSRVQLDSGRYY